MHESITPPAERDFGSSALASVLIHILFIFFVTAVVNWPKEKPRITIQAELWPAQPEVKLPFEPVAQPPADSNAPDTPSAVPPLAAPIPMAAPKPAPAAKPEPGPGSAPAPNSRVDAAERASTDIVTDKKKTKKLQNPKATKKAVQAENARKLQQEKEAAAKAEQWRKQKEKEEAEATAARKQKEKEEAEATAARKQKEKEEAEAAARKQKEKEEAEAAARKQKEKEEAARKERERQRKDQEDRITKIAKETETIKEYTEDQRERIKKTAADSMPAQITAQIADKISDKYAARIEAAIRPNITFNPATILGNPTVEITVLLDAEGIIKSKFVAKSSGVSSWDNAALAGLSKTERLPKDENGRAPQMLTITLKPRDR